MPRMSDYLFDDLPVRPEPQPAPLEHERRDSTERAGRRLVREIERWLRAQPEA
jgi:hypothetical protein